MKKNQFYFYAIIAAMVAAPSLGCKKIAEKILEDPCADIRFCNIKSYSFPGFGTSFAPNTASFTFDGYGNPLKVVNTFVSTGAPDLIFRYDALHRLSEFFRPYANGEFETWSKYVYDASGRVAFDTTYVFGSITPLWPPTDFTQRRLTTYEYDGTCRVIKTSTIGIGGVEDGSPPIVNTYTYDADGNLIRPGISYDNKVNIHRTNKVFMFVDRDFSMNNPFTASTYNGFGLPQMVGSPTAGPSVYFLQRVTDHSTFVYQCD